MSRAGCIVVMVLHHDSEARQGLALQVILGLKGQYVKSWLYTVVVMFLYHDTEAYQGLAIYRYLYCLGLGIKGTVCLELVYSGITIQKACQGFTRFLLEALF
jgi:uncharacterized membrane protein YeaQ/YmgE (transglycosylase-associated protein family)